ncbi:MAG: FAD binding domain-containing protein, partial [Acidobacteriales bacterium]|nr:FAD binding domain-containing protein [Terriglobales bacterium]
GLDRIGESANGVVIGPLVTLAQIADHAMLRERYPALADAALWAATPQIRNMATLGGNLAQRPRCWYFRNEEYLCRKKGGTRCFAQDGENQNHAIFDNRTCAIVHPSGAAVPLVAYGASLEITNAKGKRQVALEKFFTTPEEDVTRENILQSGDIITAITLPPARGLRSAYHKEMEKQSFDWPLADVAVVLSDAKAAVVLGAAAPVPYRAAQAEARLAGQTITPQLAAEAARAAVANATPLAKNGYKVPIFEAVIRRTILKAAGIGQEAHA